MSRASRSSLELLLAFALSGASTVALGQQDLTLPPRLGDAPPAAAAQRDEHADANPAAADAAETGPGGAELAAQPKARADSLEEVVVVGQGWRLPALPDLGSSWRQTHAPNKEGRIHVGFTPLYDPSASPTASDVFLTNREIRRVGFLQLFQVRFGGHH
jgi:hypothetical protein